MSLIRRASGRRTLRTRDLVLVRVAPSRPGGDWGDWAPPVPCPFILRADWEPQLHAAQGVPQAWLRLLAYFIQREVRFPGSDATYLDVWTNAPTSGLLHGVTADQIDLQIEDWEGRAGSAVREALNVIRRFIPDAEWDPDEYWATFHGPGWQLTWEAWSHNCTGHKESPTAHPASRGRNYWLDPCIDPAEFLRASIAEQQQRDRDGRDRPVLRVWVPACKMPSGAEYRLASFNLYQTDEG